MIAIAVLLGSLVYYHHAVCAANGGTLVYAMDDAYIHLGMARNVAQHGTWGINAHEISSASSSPLWVLLLAALYPMLSSEYLPLVLNTLIALLLLLSIHSFFKKQALNIVQNTAGLLLVIFALPLPALIFSGMEHILHTLTSLLLLMYAVELLVERRITNAHLLRLALLCFVNTAIRPEGIALSMIVTLLVFILTSWRQASVLLLVNALPIVAFGLWSLAHGELFFPNSVIVKSVDNMNIQQGVSGLRALFPRLGIALSLLREYEDLLWCFEASALLLAVYWLRNLRQAAAFSVKTLLEDKTTLRFGIVFFCILAHILVSGGGWFFRYEAYLVGLTLVPLFAILAPLLRQWLQGISLLPRLLLLSLVVAICFPIFSRSLQGVRQIVPYTEMVYQKQIQTARFLSSYYRAKPVGVTDIGAVCYYGGAELTDFYGLGSSYVARCKAQGSWNAAKVEELAKAKGWQCAFTYEALQSAFIPASWIKVGEMTIDERLITYHHTLTFYAPAPEYADELRHNLQAFASTLPPVIRMQIIKTNSSPP